MSVKAEAKKIMDEFIKALDKVPEIRGDIGPELESSVRTPMGDPKSDEFKELFLKNTPRTHNDFVLAEKKKW